MRRTSTTGDRAPRHADPALVIVLAGLLGLVAVFRADLEVSATVLVVGAGVMVGVLAGARTRPHEHRHGLLLLSVLVVPMIALVRWAGPYGLIWFAASGAGALIGRSQDQVDSDAGWSRAAGTTTRPLTDAGQLDQAGRDLPWMLVILAGLLLPVATGLTAIAWGASVAVRVVVVIATIVATDSPLVIAGMRGKGADGIVQPWRWPAYLGYLVIRLLVLLPTVVVPWNG